MHDVTFDVGQELIYNFPTYSSYAYNGKVQINNFFMIFIISRMKFANLTCKYYLKRAESTQNNRQPNACVYSLNVAPITDLIMHSMPNWTTNIEIFIKHSKI